MAVHFLRALRERIREEEIEETLDRHEHDLKEMAKRVRRLEAEAGIYYPSPPLKEVNDP